MTAMLAPISDPESAASVVPLLVRGPADALKELRRLDMSRAVDAVQAAQRDELIGRLATAIDLPPEVLRGMTDANHWTAKQVQHDMWRSHGVNVAERFCDDVADAYLRAKAEVENIRRRADEDIAKARKFAVEGFAEAMLPVMDSLDGAIATPGAAVEVVLEGVHATRRQLASALEVDLLDAAARKMVVNAAKYPVEKARGRADRASEL